MAPLVRVQQSHDDGTATVCYVRQSGCAVECRECAGCGTLQRNLQLRVDNAIQARPGQLAILRECTGRVLAVVAILSMIPPLMFFAGYLLSASLWGQGPLGGGVGFAAGVTAAAICRQLMAKKQCCMYTLAQIQPEDFSKYLQKGDNDLD